MQPGGREHRSSSMQSTDTQSCVGNARAPCHARSLVDGLDGVHDASHGSAIPARHSRRPGFCYREQEGSETEESAGAL